MRLGHVLGGCVARRLLAYTLVFRHSRLRRAARPGERECRRDRAERMAGCMARQLGRPAAPRALINAVLPREMEPSRRQYVEWSQRRSQECELGASPSPLTFPF